MEKLIPQWFEDWFDEKFPRGLEPYAPLYIAKKLKVNKNVIYRALLMGELEGFRISSGRWMVPRTALKQWLLEKYSLNLP